MSNSKKGLFKSLGPALSGALDPNTGLSGRTFERTQGCWNCIHGDHDKAKAVWKDRRQADLAIAARKALESPMGENDPNVVNIRRLVDAIDRGIASGTLTKCTGPGVDSNGNAVGDFVKNNYLCHQWTARQGASVARAGQKADDLPAELEDKSN